MRWLCDDVAMDEVAVAERSRLLDRAVSQASMRGATLVSRGPFEAVLEFGKLPNHILHLLLTLVTCGLWAVVWLILTISSTVTRRTVLVDEYGRAWISGGTGWEPFR